VCRVVSYRISRFCIRASVPVTKDLLAILQKNADLSRLVLLYTNFWTLFTIQIKCNLETWVVFYARHRYSHRFFTVAAESCGKVTGCVKIVRRVAAKLCYVMCGISKTEQYDVTDFWVQVGYIFTGMQVWSRKKLRLGLPVKVQVSIKYICKKKLQFKHSVSCDGSKTAKNI